MQIIINVPNDSNSESDETDAIEQCYAGDEAAAEADCGQELYEVMAQVAKKAGLLFVKPTDFGVMWEGTEGQCQTARLALPSWAGVSEVEE